MIVVAIIGILASVALPAYQDYTARAKVSEVIGFIAAAKTGVTEFYSSEGQLNGVTSAKAGVETSPNSSYVDSIAVTADTGVITATVKGLNNACDTKTIILTPTEDTTSKTLTWAGTADTECQKYVPANFR